jgi:hypothetical protein
MKIVRPYNQVVNEAKNNLHLLNRDQIAWCSDNIREAWYVNEDGEVFTNSKTVSLYSGEFEEIPVQFADCLMFTLAYNHKLTTLNGSPRRVKHSYAIEKCTSLESLYGGPDFVGGSYLIQSTSIESLEGSPIEVVGSYRIMNNKKLISVHRITKNIGRNIEIADSPLLRSLDGIPKDFKGNIDAYANGLPEKELIYNWQNDITQDEVDQFKQDWEI